LPEAKEALEPTLEPYSGPTLYPPIRHTPEEILAWRKECDSYDRMTPEQQDAHTRAAIERRRGEPTTPVAEGVEEYAVRK
jgi:hypothetical protein